MFGVDESKVVAIQNGLDQVARDCLKAMMRRELTHDTRMKLAKFLYGLMNQRLTIIQRVKLRGPSEFDKVLQFAGRAYEALELADLECSCDTNPPDDHS